MNSKISFKFQEDKEFFIKLLSSVKNKLNKNEFDLYFDFRDAKTKRDEFNLKRNDILNELQNQHGVCCQLNLLDNCDCKQGIGVDHYIRLSSDELNKNLRGLKPTKGHKVISQSFGSNNIENMLLACKKCNAYKKHRFIFNDSQDKWKIVKYDK